jgi:hypothetical protein
MNSVITINWQWEPELARSLPNGALKYDAIIQSKAMTSQNDIGYFKNKENSRDSVHVMGTQPKVFLQCYTKW